MSAPLAPGQPIAPDLKILTRLQQQAVSAGWLTNEGALQRRFERDLAGLIPGAGTVACVSSGTDAVMMALRLGGLPKGAEVITTPLSFAATAQAIEWCGFTPVFADIDPETLTLDPEAVRRAITKRTAAILPVHLFGVPCDHAALSRIARDHGLWLAYDGAHSFGVTVDGCPILTWGDASAMSLHATKLLHTGEGGAVITPRQADWARLRRMRNFGLEAGRSTGVGVNAKMSEFHAAVGLSVLPKLEAEIAARRAIRARYAAAFSGQADVRLQDGGGADEPGLTFCAIRLRPDAHGRALDYLARDQVLARPAWPLLCGVGSAFPGHSIVTAGGAPVAPVVAPEIMCLPLSGHMDLADADRIADRVLAALRAG